MGNILADLIREVPEMARQSREAELKSKGEKLEKLETWGCAVIFFALVAGLAWATFRLSAPLMRYDIDKLEKRVEAIEQRIVHEGSVAE